MDVDVNAARNILEFGISSTGGHPGMACESSQTIGRKQEEDAREGRSSALLGPRVVTSFANRPIRSSFERPCNAALSPRFLEPELRRLDAVKISAAIRHDRRQSDV
jgi:hypothetical protein